MKLIPKDVVVTEIEKSIKLLFENNDRIYDEYGNYFYKNAENDYRFYHKLDEYDWDEDRMTLTDVTEYLLHFNTLEVKDLYEQCVQYDSIKAGIKAHAETYSFNIESKLFHQLTEEQQKLWRKEIEQAVISGGEMGVELARDMRYKENIEVKEVDLNKEIKSYFKGFGKFPSVGIDDCIDIAKHFFELGLMYTLSWKDIRLIAEIGEEFMNSEESDAYSNEESYYTVILNKLKEKGLDYKTQRQEVRDIKAQKGE